MLVCYNFSFVSRPIKLVTFPLFSSPLTIQPTLYLPILSVMLFPFSCITPRVLRRFTISILFYVVVVSMSFVVKGQEAYLLDFFYGI